MPSATATQVPGDACSRTPLQHSLRQHSPHEHPHANNAETCRHYERGGDEVPCCMNPASCHNSAEFVFQISLLTKLPLCIEEPELHEEEIHTEASFPLRQETFERSVKACHIPSQFNSGRRWGAGPPVPAPISKSHTLSTAVERPWLLAASKAYRLH